MSMIGEVKAKLTEIEWQIPDFINSVLKRESSCYKSKEFSFAEASWYIVILPIAFTIDLYLTRKSIPLGNVQASLVIKTSDGKKYRKRNFSKQGSDKNTETFYIQNYIKIAELSEREFELLPSNVLTVLCTIELSEPSGKTGHADTAECTHCKEIVNGKDVLWHEEKCVNKPMKCPECSEVVALKEWYDHKCRVTREKEFGKLLDDLKGMMESGEYSDTTIRVKEEEFRLHKIILARNPFFHSMFKSDMKEKNTGIVTINDCELDIFRSFIHFVYTGKVDNLSSENVCSLYEVSDKYQEEHLKEKCLQFMMNSISVENLCDFIILSLRYDEKELLKNATSFFAIKTKEIICNVKWLPFLKEYPVYANELHIKALDANKNS